MPSTMLLRKLEQVLPLTKAERQTIEELPEHVLHFQRSEDVLNGSRPTSVHLLRTGIAGRYTLLGEGEPATSPIRVRLYEFAIASCFDSFAKNSSPCNFRLLQQYRHVSTVLECPPFGRCWGQTGHRDGA